MFAGYGSFMEVDQLWSECEDRFLSKERRVLLLERIESIRAEVGFYACSILQSSLDDIGAVDVEPVLDFVWERLHTGSWHEVKLEWRVVYSMASLLNALRMVATAWRNRVKSSVEEEKTCIEKLTAALHSCDMGLIMGCPLKLDSSDSVLADLAERIHVMLYDLRPLHAAQATPSLSFEVTVEHELKVVECLNMSDFRAQFFNKLSPVRIRNACEHWPARSKWNVPYILRMAGYRTVPIEVGSQYTDDSWGQRLCTVDEFVNKYIRPAKTSQSTYVGGYLQTVESSNAEAEPDGYWANNDLYFRKAGYTAVPVDFGSQYTDDSWVQRLYDAAESVKKYVPLNLQSTEGSQSTNVGGYLQTAESLNTEPEPVGYLAQYDLFAQIPSLANDVDLPEYCLCNGCDQDDIQINAWFGPSGTVSPLHHDPRHNVLVQVFGSKLVRLYAPSQTDLLYPHEEGIMTNTSRVDVRNPNLHEFPKFKHAEYVECVLQAGDMLYMPPKYWHYVQSLSESFSISFWFD